MDIDFLVQLGDHENLLVRELIDRGLLARQLTCQSPKHPNDVVRMELEENMRRWLVIFVFNKNIESQ